MRVTCGWPTSAEVPSPLILCGYAVVAPLAAPTPRFHGGRSGPTPQYRLEGTRSISGSKRLECFIKTLAEVPPGADRSQQEREKRWGHSAKHLPIERSYDGIRGDHEEWRPHQRTLGFPRATQTLSVGLRTVT